MEKNLVKHGLVKSATLYRDLNLLNKVVLK
jgi:hypothetical protein